MAATHCKHGHEWTPENTFINVRGIRECRTCRRTRNSVWKKRNPESELRYLRQPTLVACPDCGELRTVTRGASKAALTMRCPRCAAKVTAEKLRTGRYVDCETCGNQFWVTQSRLSAAARFCSRDCAYKSESRKAKLRDREGRKNPGFKHGRKTGAQIRGWGVREKGETCCRMCGATGGLHLHHIIPRGTSRAARRDLRNGMVLCNSCHMKWHRHTLTIPRELMTTEEWNYVSSVALTGQRIEDWLDRHYPSRRRLLIEELR